MESESEESIAIHQYSSKLIAVLHILVDGNIPIMFSILGGCFCKIGVAMMGKEKLKETILGLMPLIDSIKVPEEKPE